MNVVFAVLKLPRHLGADASQHGMADVELSECLVLIHMSPERASCSHSPGTNVIPGLRVNLQSGEEGVGQGRCGLVP